MKEGLQVRIPLTNVPTTRAKAWARLIQNEVLHELPMAETIFNTKVMKDWVEYAVSDSGATGHFLVEGAPVVNKRVANKPIHITLPNGKIIKSTHTCNLDIPWMPHQMTEAHIVLGLTHSSLISTRKFCEAGWKVSFNKQERRVYYVNRLVLVGRRDAKTSLWKLPINPSIPQMELSTDALNLRLSSK